MRLNGTRPSERLAGADDRQCLRIVYWFNPLVWIVWNRLRLESECACDDAVVADGSEAHEYTARASPLDAESTDRAWSAAMTMSRQLLKGD